MRLSRRLMINLVAVGMLFLLTVGWVVFTIVGGGGLAAPYEVTSISRRRSIASAIAPPSRPKTISGTKATIEVTPTSSEEPVSW